MIAAVEEPDALVVRVHIKAQKLPVEVHSIYGADGDIREAMQRLDHRLTWDDVARLKRHLRDAGFTQRRSRVGVMQWKMGRAGPNDQPWRLTDPIEEGWKQVWLPNRSADQQRFSAFWCAARMAWSTTFCSVMDRPHPDDLATIRVAWTVGALQRWQPIED